MKIDKVVVLVTGILRNPKGEILLLKRSKKNKTFVGFWHLLEGKIEGAEQPVEALAREIQEEIGCRLILAKPVTAKAVIITLRGVNYRVVRIAFEVQWKGTITLSDEHSAHRWVSLDKAARIDKLVDGTREILLSLADFIVEREK